MKRFLLLALSALLAGRAQAGSVKGSRHDFSATGPGPFRAASERSPCVFCHASHGAGPGLTNRPDPRAGHTPYQSSTSTTRGGAPTGASRICLSCHDGTIAVGETRTRRIRMAGDDFIPKGHRANLGTDLRTSHPVSIRPAAGGRTHAPPPRDRVRYDAGGELQCTSCHDPHDERDGDPVVGKFLVKPSADSALCLTCHDTLAVAASDSSHARTSAPGGPALAARGYQTVSQAGCAACHSSHGGDTRGRLLRPRRTDDDDCLDCHGVTGTAKSVGADVARQWAHASTAWGDHDEAEGRELRQAGRSAGIGRRKRHVACVDCHNPHATTSRFASAPAVNGALAGVAGIDVNGNTVDPARFEYEVCLKCHGDSQPSVATTLGGLDSVRRAVDGANLRLVFSTSSPSFHPVASPGRNPSVNGLKAPYTVASQIYCSDCHASDRSEASGGAGARGPHGSSYPHILERNYSATDPSVESPEAYALCFKCHDRDTLYRDGLTGSGFGLNHRKHVVERSISCATCHDAHGVSALGGSPTENAHLVSFNLSAVSANTLGRAVYASEGPGKGSCNLSCHNHPNSQHDGVTKGRYGY